MANLPGVYPAKKKNGEKYYRASITYHRKHISLGSFTNEPAAAAAYQLAADILFSNNLMNKPKSELYIIDDYVKKGSATSFDKWVMLLNFKDNNMYCRNPIYLQHRYFIYYLDMKTALKFDADDLFYYMNHKIMRRGGHLFVSDYGMQVNILSRYGIKNYAVSGKDYRFVNGDITDYRYGNIEIINRYYGVTKSIVKGKPLYTVKIHVNGDIIVGRYLTEEEGAVAYNKAVKVLLSKGITKGFQENYIESLNEIEYAKLYNSVRISKKVRSFNS